MYLMNMLNFWKCKNTNTLKCHKRNKPICRFGFPKPPMSSTYVLQLLNTENAEEAKANYDKRSFSQKTKMELICLFFKEFLDHLDLTEEEYINSVQSDHQISHCVFEMGPSGNPKKSIHETYMKQHLCCKPWCSVHHWSICMCCLHCGLHEQVSGRHEWIDVQSLQRRTVMTGASHGQIIQQCCWNWSPRSSLFGAPAASDQQGTWSS